MVEIDVALRLNRFLERVDNTSCNVLLLLVWEIVMAGRKMFS